jgi:hypothetical protein
MPADPAHAESRASLIFALISYAAFVEPPIIGETAPVSISDTELEFERQNDGRWLIAQYRVSPLLVNRTH